MVVAEEVTKAYGDRAIVRDFSTRILRGDRVGIVGPNGAGKTTLLNLLTGVLAPDAGEIRLGTNLAQVDAGPEAGHAGSRADPQPDADRRRRRQVEVGGQRRHVIGYMKDFLFGPEQANTPVGVLSGGERGRLTLARAFARPSNLLVLDEPTNDLDLETLDLLQERLAEYAGTVLLVSHDRDFLDRVVTSVIAAEGDGRWIEYAGGYTDMLAQRGPAAARADSRLTPKPRGAVVAPKPRGSPVEAKLPRQVPVGPPQAATRPRRLTFKDRHALEALPTRIAGLQAEVAKLSAALADPDLYARDPSSFGDTTQALRAAQEALASAEEQWLMLEMLREEIEG